MRERVLKKLFLRWRRRGDGRALAFDSTARELLGVAAHLVPGTGEGEDLVQLTFLRAMERAASFDEQAELLPWLHGILWREAMAARRRPNVYGRALWGLSYGIEPAQGPLVLQAACELFEARSDVGIQVDCLDPLGQHAGPELEPWLASVAADTRRPEAVRSR